MADTADTTPTEIETLFELLNKVDEDMKSLKATQAELRKVAKVVQKQLKAAQSKKKKKVKDPNAPKRPPAGFAKPTPLSGELCKFLGVDESTLIARTDVTRKITEYIKANNLQNPENKREIVLDAPLRKLLNPPADVTVTFFTLQTYLKNHFPSTKSVDTASIDTVTTPSKPTPATTAKPATTNEKKKHAVKKKLEGGRARVSA